MLPASLPETLPPLNQIGEMGTNQRIHRVNLGPCMIDKLQLPAGVELGAIVSPATSKILVPEATELIAALHRNFNDRRKELLQRRCERQTELDRGKVPDFLTETIVVLTM